MKRSIFIGLILLSSNFSQAAALKCWDRYSKQLTLTATHVSDSQLKGLRFHTDKDRDSNDRNKIIVIKGTIKGRLITSNRSPYKGNNTYTLDKYSELVLPVALDPESMKEALRTGIGRGTGENGVVIGYFMNGGEGSGSHYSVRMRCYSYEN